MLVVGLLALLPFVIKSGEAGIFVVAATQPWITLLSLLVSTNETLNRSEALGLVIISLSALLNAALIHLVCRRLLTKALGVPEDLN